MGAFLVIAIGLLAQEAPQTRAEAARPEVYQRPAVSPYEPPSDFGRRRSEGDAAEGADRHPGRASTAEVDYARAVDRARARADALMGPLDGAWRVQAADGSTVLDLILTDRGPDLPVEGGWSRAHDGVSRIGAVASVVRGANHVEVRAEIEGRATVLSLTRDGDAWSGALHGLGRDRAVRMVRAD